MKINFILPTVLIFSLFFVTGCSGKKNYGTVVENHKVTSIFRAHTVQENYNYFYYGVYSEPDVILGIDERYTVLSKFWSPVELTPELLAKWVTDLDRIRGDRNFSPRYMGRYQGAYILNPDGLQVGIWYSKLDWGVFEFREENIIVPYTPSLRPGSPIRRFNDDD